MPLAWVFTSSQGSTTNTRASSEKVREEVIYENFP
jgi:hypothetical protein